MILFSERSILLLCNNVMCLMPSVPDVVANNNICNLSNVERRNVIPLKIVALSRCVKQFFSLSK